jgi:hypothetical protein
MITWKNVANELVVRLHSSAKPRIFVSYRQVRTIWGEVGSGFPFWCNKHEIHSEEQENGYMLQHRPKAR